MDETEGAKARQIEENGETNVEKTAKLSSIVSYLVGKLVQRTKAWEAWCGQAWTCLVVWLTAPVNYIQLATYDPTPSPPYPTH